MANKKLDVQGMVISIDTINDDDYVSLTDIAKQVSDEPRFVIRNWMTNQSTIRYLGKWEELHNPNFKRAGFHTFKEAFFESPFSVTPKKWLDETDAIGIVSKAGRYGGTFSHKDIAINFCYYINPEFQVYFIKAFQELLEAEYNRQNLEWHISKITDNIDEVRNLLDTIPGQAENRNRLEERKKKQ